MDQLTIHFFYRYLIHKFIESIFQDFSYSSTILNIISSWFMNSSYIKSSSRSYELRNSHRISHSNFQSKMNSWTRAGFNSTSLPVSALSCHSFSMKMYIQNELTWFDADLNYIIIRRTAGGRQILRSAQCHETILWETSNI